MQCHANVIATNTHQKIGFLTVSEENQKQTIAYSEQWVSFNEIRMFIDYLN